MQPKLTLSQPGDRYEQEADRVAEQIMSTPEPGLQRRVDEEEEELLQTKTVGQGRAGGDVGVQSEVPPIVHEVLDSPGRHLDRNTLAFMEPRFGHDFSQVRVHTHSKATESARALNASAYTLGHNIVFGSGDYKPNMTAGRWLLAHELAHVVQQGASAVHRNRFSPLTAAVTANRGAGNQRSYGTVQGEEGGRRTQPKPSVTIAGKTESRPAEEEEIVPPPVEAESGRRPPEIQRNNDDAPPTLARPSLTFTPGATLTRGDSLTAAVSFTPTAGERINVTSWEYITPSHGTVSRPTTDADFQTRWAGTMALSGTIRLQWHYLPTDTLVETLEQPITVNDRTGATWTSAVTDNDETALTGMPTPPRQFRQLGHHDARVTDPTITDSTVNGGPNHDFAFVSTLTAGRYTSSPEIHPDVTNSSSPFLLFHRDGSVLFKVAIAGGAKTRIPVGQYSNFVQDPLSWDVPDWEAFYKQHDIYTVRATADTTTHTVANANWGLDSNAADAGMQITNDAAVRAQLGIGPGDSYSVSVTVNFNWEGYALMASAAIPPGVRSHEYSHVTHSHRANFHKMMRALDPQKVIERTVSTPSNPIDFATKLADLRTEILAPYHEIVDEAESARQERFVAVAGATMAAVNTNPDTGDFLGNVWDITGNAPMT